MCIQFELLWEGTDACHVAGGMPLGLDLSLGPTWGAAAQSPGQDTGGWCRCLWEDVMRLLLMFHECFSVWNVLPVLGKLDSRSSWCYGGHFRCYGKMSCWGDAYRNLKKTRKAHRGNSFLLVAAERSRQGQALLCPPASQSPCGAAYMKNVTGSQKSRSPVCRVLPSVTELSVRMGLGLEDNW